MPIYDKAIEVAVPASVAYRQWDTPESFSRFMSGVEHVTERDHDHSHWMTGFAGVQREFDVEIVERLPDERITWRATSGARHSGSVTFAEVGEGRSRVSLHMDYEPDGALEAVGSALGVVGARLQSYLKGFKSYIESDHPSTG
ncbi:SRPBCC family protein [Umezawaea endophytica]|uniref:SRPBCC family protein n=1 Tax=Umezawaea endophytica TaxID=1654476 RepID=A0A9X3AIG0_9PSEU|nr:SRPBCC family protein [Umezawaea endophytica]MCS7480495.1 SRPBCC family protein [Umezawaea endophytica]